MFRSTAKACIRITEENAAQTIYDAFRLAAQPRPGPVMVEIPRNLGDAEASVDLTTSTDPVAGDPDPAEIDAVCDMVASFRKPVIIAGDDVRREGVLNELKSVAESLQAVVLPTMDGRGVFPETDQRFGCVYVGTPPPRALYRSFLNESDGVLVVGADGRMKESRWDIDVPVCELLTGSQFPALSDTPRMRVNGRLAPTLKRLVQLRNTNGFPKSRVAELRASVRNRFARPQGAQFTANDIIVITREKLPKDGCLFTETGIAQPMLEHLWPVTVPDTFFCSTVGRTMGLTLPALLGARLACPNRPMIGLTTDGSTLMRLGDLEAYARTGAAAPIVILNDGALGTIRAQQKFKGMPDYGLGLELVDFAKLAHAVGISGVTVNTPEDFSKALGLAMTADKATVIDARVDPQAYRDTFMLTTGLVS